MLRVHCAVPERRSGSPATTRQSFGGHGEGETPGPIPNPEAKPFSADGTARPTAWESRTPPDTLSRRATRFWVALLACPTSVGERQPCRIPQPRPAARTRDARRGHRGGPEPARLPPGHARPPRTVSDAGQLQDRPRGAGRRHRRRASGCRPRTVVRDPLPDSHSRAHAAPGLATSRRGASVRPTPGPPEHNHRRHPRREPRAEPPDRIRAGATAVPPQPRQPGGCRTVAPTRRRASGVQPPAANRRELPPSDGRSAPIGRAGQTQPIGPLDPPGGSGPRSRRFSRTPPRTCSIPRCRGN